VGTLSTAVFEHPETGEDLVTVTTRTTSPVVTPRHRGFVARESRRELPARNISIFQ